MIRGLHVDLGRIGYVEAFEIQKTLAAAVASAKLPPTILTLEHDPVFTLGAAFHEENLPLARASYADAGIDIQRTDRGGDVTYHGPNQLVAYPIVSLEVVGKDLHKWLRGLEETVIIALKAWGLESRRFPPHTGVWIEDRKVCAIGIKVKKWVSMHGIALNCDNDLSPFQMIVPCGIRGYSVTSLQRETGQIIDRFEAGAAFLAAFSEVFQIEVETQSKSNFLDEMSRLELCGDR